MTRNQRSIVAALLVSVAPLATAEAEGPPDELAPCLRAADARELAADRYYAAGKFREALATYQAATRCEGTEPVVHLRAKMALAACHAGDRARVLALRRTLPHAYRRALEPICAVQQIELRPPPGPPGPPALDATMVEDSIAPQRAALERCQQVHAPKLPRTVLRITVDAHGVVTHADAGTAPSAPCLTAVARTIQFPATRVGGTFRVAVLTDPSGPADLAEGHALRHARDGKLVDAVRQYAFVMTSNPQRVHVERAIATACRAKLAADATVFGWHLPPPVRKPCP